MGDKVEDHTKELENSEITFDNQTILKELRNIVNLVSNEDFLETVPKAKLRNVKWVPIFDRLKQVILHEITQELSSMWERENMPDKLEILEKQKKNFTDIAADNVLWRPQLADVKGQLKASDVADLNNQKVLLESLAIEYEARVNRLKKIVSAKRSYLKVLQFDIQEYQKKNEELASKISTKLENHTSLISSTLPTKQTDIQDTCCKEEDLEINEIK